MPKGIQNENGTHFSSMWTVVNIFEFDIIQSNVF